MDLDRFIWWLSVNHLHNFTRLKMNLQWSTHTHPRLGIYIYTHVGEKFYTYTVNMFKTMYMQNIRMHLSHPYIPMCGEGSHDETCKISKHYTHGIWSQQQIWCINIIYIHKHYSTHQLMLCVIRKTLTHPCHANISLHLGNLKKKLQVLYILVW